MMASDSVNLFQEGPPVASGPVCAPIKSLIFGREVLRASACRLKVVLFFRWRKRVRRGNKGGGGRREID
jgi:hypothetical protein